MEDEREERDDREESDTMDSGDDAVDTELAREDRRTGQYPWGDEVTEQGKRSRDV
jgi:hypothetical protein